MKVLGNIAAYRNLFKACPTPSAHTIALMLIAAQDSTVRGIQSRPKFKGEMMT
jgi:hypothetical protein